MKVSSLDPQIFKDRCIVWYGFSHRLSESGLRRVILKSKFCQHEDGELFIYDYENVNQFNSSLSIKAEEDGAVSPDSIIEAEDDSIISTAPRKLVKFSMLCE